MAQQQVIDLTDPANFNFDTNEIEIDGSGGRLKIKDDPGVFNQNFSTSFSVPAELEFDSGVLQQVDQALPDSTFTATYTNSIDGNYGDGVLTGTAIGGASISGNKLDLKGGTTQYVDYSAVGNSSSLQQGAIRFKITPNYSGIPATLQAPVVIARDDNDRRNHVVIFHQTNGNLAIQTRDLNDVIIVNAGLGVWNPVAGTTYEFEFNWDIAGGDHRVFIDGVQFGTTQIGTGTRDSNIGLLRVGSSYTGNADPNFEIEDVVIFDTVQHVSDYTPGYTLSENRYLEAKADLPAFSYLGAGNIQSFNNFLTISSAGIKFIIDGLYWNGSSWVTSISNAQSNTQAEVVANISTLPVTDNPQFSVVFFENNTTQENIDDLTLEYTGQIYSTDVQVIELDTAQIEISLDQLISILESVNVTGSDSITYVLEQGPGNPVYWDGANWVTSNKSIAQSNTIAEIDAGKASFVQEGFGFILGVNWLLKSNDGSTTPIANTLTLEYDFFGVAPVLNQAIVYSTLLDPSGSPLANKTIKVRSTYIFGSNSIITTDYATVTTNSNGYWEMVISYEDVLPVSLTWDIDGFIIQTNFLSGNNSFSALTRLFGC